MNERIIKNNKWLFEQLQVKCWWNNTSKNSMILKKTQSYWVFKTQCDSLKLVKKPVIKVLHVCFDKTSYWCWQEHHYDISPKSKLEVFFAPSWLIKFFRPKTSKSIFRVKKGHNPTPVWFRWKSLAQGFRIWP